MLALATNISLLFVMYSVCKIVFLLINLRFFPDLTFGHTIHLLKAGIVFDTVSILYTNGLYIVLFLFPYHLKDNYIYFGILKYLYLVINAIAIIINFADTAYFPYTTKRTTFTVFEQFAGEDNIKGIIGLEVANHWYLVVVLVIMVWLLYKLYRQPKLEANTGNKYFYYISRTLTITVLVPVSIILIRGGSAADTRPMTISNANEYVKKPRETAIVLNTTFTMLRTINRKAYITPTYYSNKEELESIYTPIHIPSDTIEFKNKNVVMLILESFGKEYWGFYNKGRIVDGEEYRGYTTFMDSLANESLTFKYSFANGIASIDGMPSNIASIPMLVEHFFKTSASLNDISSAAKCLSKDKGYYTAFFHGAQKHSMGFMAFSRSAGFNDYFSRDDYNNDDDFDGRWGIWDGKFLPFFNEKLSTFKEPFMAGIFTLSSHHPFSIPKEYKDKYTDGKIPIHNTIRYSDDALRAFFEKAKKEPWFKNTLFVITADHTNDVYIKEYHTETNRFAVPIIFYTPDGSLKGYRDDIIAAQIDIMPSILGYLGYDKPYFAFGQDLFNTKPEDTYAFNYITGTFQLIKGDYLLQFVDNKVKAIYKYKTDVLLQENLVGKVPEQAEMERLMKAIIQQYIDRINTDRLTVKG